MPAGPVLPVDESTAAPHTVHREMVTELDWYKGIGTPIKFSRTKGGTRRPPPKFNEHGAEVLTQHGYTADRNRCIARNRRAACQAAAVAVVLDVAAGPARREVLKLPGKRSFPGQCSTGSGICAPIPRQQRSSVTTIPAAVLGYYLELGQKLGHSPNRMFDEQWHRQMYPQIVERIEAGHYPSAFDAYCRCGNLDRSPHWLFDELGYRDRYPDLTDAVLAEFGLCNGFDHYLRHGVEEDRIGHMLFDPKMYLSHFDEADVAAIRRADYSSTT